MSIKKHELWADYLKGICILLVYFGHLDLLPQYLRVFIYLFHMPAFFFCIGFYDNVDVDFCPYINKKFKSLLIPFFFISFLRLAFITFEALINYGTIDWIIVFNTIIGIFINLRNSIFPSNYWFLIASFTTCILYYLITHKIKNERMRFIVVIFLSLIITYVSRTYKMVLPWYIDVSILCLIFVLFGNYVKEKNMIISKLKAFICFVLGTIIVFFVYYTLRNEEVKFLVDYHTARTYPYILVISGGLLFLMSFYGFLFKIKRKSIVSYIGENSLIYYLFDSVTYAVFNRILKILNMKICNEYMNVFINILCILFVTPIIVMIIKRYFWFLFGKKQETWSFKYRNR